MSVFEYHSYKKFLKDRIESLKRVGLMTELAQSAGCDRTYLSQVLSGKAHLTSDHAVNLAESLGLSGDESDYFLLLVLRERSSNSDATARISAKLERMRRANLDLSKKIRQSDGPVELAEAGQLIYYRSWKYAAAHILLSLPSIRTPAHIARALRIDEAEAENIVETLQAMGLVKRHGLQYEHSGKNLHIPNDSPLVAINHLNWRMRAMEAANAARPGENVHYTDVFSISESDVPAFSALVLDFIEKARKKTQSSGAEAAFALCCDFFPLSKDRRLGQKMAEIQI